MASEDRKRDGLVDAGSVRGVATRLGEFAIRRQPAAPFPDSFILREVPGGHGTHTRIEEFELIGTDTIEISRAIFNSKPVLRAFAPCRNQVVSHIIRVADRGPILRVTYRAVCDPGPLPEGLIIEDNGV